VNPRFWNRKKVFLTGHTGFKGSWLSLWLQSMGAEVVGFSLLPPTSPSLYEMAGISADMESLVGDIRDQVALKEAVVAASPDILFHMAAQPLVGLSYEDPITTYSTNLMGTVNVLEAVRGASSIKAVVNVTSDKCYENREWSWGYREDEAMGGYDPYSASKGCAELITASYRSSFFNPLHYESHQVALASARAGNVIGGGDWGINRLVPDILKSLSDGIVVSMRNPGAIRPWQHVLEPLNGYLVLAEKLYMEGPVFAEGWNFGPDDAGARAVDWIVQNLIKKWGTGSSCIADGAARVHEANFLKLDSSKARSLLGWQPTWSLDLALEKICDWHKSYLSGANMKDLTLRQIQEFQSDM
jgi:CDP-glucose 4,6-dehydratase